MLEAKRIIWALILLIALGLGIYYAIQFVSIDGLVEERKPMEREVIEQPVAVPEETELPEQSANEESAENEVVDDLSVERGGEEEEVGIPEEQDVSDSQGSGVDLIDQGAELAEDGEPLAGPVNSGEVESDDDPKPLEDEDLDSNEPDQSDEEEVSPPEVFENELGFPDDDEGGEPADPTPGQPDTQSF